MRFVTRLEDVLKECIVQILSLIEEVTFVMTRLISYGKSRPHLANEDAIKEAFQWVRSENKYKILVTCSVDLNNYVNWIIYLYY